MAKHGYQSLSGVKGNILAIAVMFLPCWQHQCTMRLEGGGLDGGCCMMVVVVLWITKLSASFNGGKAFREIAIVLTNKAVAMLSAN